MTESGYGRELGAQPPVEDAWRVPAAPTPGDQSSFAASVPPPLPRPRQARTASILLILFGVLGLLLGLVLLSEVHQDQDDGETVSSVLSAAAYLQLLLSAAEVVSGVLVLRGTEWARILAVVLCGLDVLSGLVSLFSGGGFQGVFGILLNIAVIRMLFNQDVVEWCRQP